MTETAITETFPTVIDNTIRSAFFSCPTRARWSFFRNLAPERVSVHLHAGGAFARGLEVARREYYDNGADNDTALMLGTQALVTAYGDFEPPDTGSGAVKTCERMVEAMESYFERYPLANDKYVPLKVNGRSAVEFTGCLPIPGCFHPITGEQLQYAIRFDMLAVNNGVLWGVDEKTTGSLGTSWASQWDLASQFTGYCWGAREYGYDLAGFIIRGIGLLKTETKHVEVPIFRPAFQVDRWLTQLQRDVRRMCDVYTTGKWDYALGHACSDFGGCSFRSLCLSQTPEQWVAGRFVERNWNPLAHD